MVHRAFHHRPWLKLVLLVAVTGSAAFLRLHRIGSLPPADGYDAAYYGVDALQLLGGQPPRTMYPPNREPLFSYLVAGSFLLFGGSTMAIHLTSALVGIFTVPLVYLAAEALFQSAEEPLRRWGGLLAALMMAVSYWHLNWSRIGVRAILVPLFAAATVLFLWRGLQDERRVAFVLCGISLGLSLYTYQAARLLPVLVVAGFAVSSWERGAVNRHHWQGLIIVAVLSLLVFAPLGIHFVTHPGSFSRRIEEAMVVQPDQATGSSLQAVASQAWEAVLAFSFVGDQTPYSTIPGRPSLNPFLSVLLAIGIGMSLLQVRRPNRALPLIWLGLMTVPAALAGKGPTAKRAIGALPAVAMLIAIGALTPWTLLRRWLERRDRRPRGWVRATWIVILLCGFALSGVVTYRDYFVVWASNPDLPKHFEADISAMGEYIGDLPAKQQVYLSPELPKHPAIRFHADLREGVRGYNGRVCFAAPRETEVETTYVIVQGVGDTSLSALETHFPEGEKRAHSPRGDRAAFVSFTIPAGARANIQPAYPLEATWAERIQLVGYAIEKESYRPGEAIALELTYLDLKPMTEHYTVFVHLVGPVNPRTGDPLWGQNDSEPCHGFYPTTSWHEGEILVDRINLRIADDAPAGTYRLSTGFYDIWTGERLEVMSEAAPTENRALVLDEVRIGPAE
jgi:4-amino-4-deoxy-L-arabinose transferase-like glycosyltransferase